MTIKIKKLQVRNFKTFKDITVEINDAVLTVLDGPNGFGKTSFFDAIELLLTGTLRRYESLAEKVVDKRRKDTGHPFLYDRQGAEGDLIIKILIEIDDEELCLFRLAKRTDLENYNGTDTSVFSLYKCSSFSGNKDVDKIENEEEFLTELLGSEYKKNFEFLNYIEQEENTYLLHHKDKDRKDKIAFLFNTSDYENRIKKLTAIEKKIGVLCNPQARREIKHQEDSLKREEANLTQVANPVAYKRLVATKENSWDSEELDFPSNQLAQWLGKNGLLDNIQEFIINFQEYYNDHINIIKRKKLWPKWPKDEVVIPLLEYGKFIDEREQYKAEHQIHSDITLILATFDGDILRNIRRNQMQIKESLIQLAATVINIDDYHALLTSISNQDTQSTKVSVLIQNVISSRSSFHQAFSQYSNEADEQSECPMCGYDWESVSNLSEQLESQSGVLQELAKSMGSDITLSLDKLRNNFIAPLKSFFKQYLDENPVDIKFLSNLLKLNDKQISYLRNLKKAYESYEVDITTYFKQTISQSEDIDINRLRELVTSTDLPVNYDSVKPYFDNLYVDVFNEDKTLVDTISYEDLTNKRAYIQWKYSLVQSSGLKRKRKLLTTNQEEFDKAEKLKKKLSVLRTKIYSDTLKEYQRELIGGIEILFHIYSGRIVQNCQGGLGLFIKSDKDGIRFLENLNKSHDAVFSMSSGQLAALVISFTLALNKRYSKSRLLFIDDPIQTLDELNISGLVDLLRNEFSDSQIFISTHEDMMSTYMRYKFMKYDLVTKRINFKELYLSQEL